jgi:BASS family bile acid:Na+ symporter
MIQLGSYMVLILMANLIFLKVNDTGFTGYLIASAKSLALFFVAPIILAMLFKYFMKGNMMLMKKILSLFSMVGIVIILTIITAAGRDALLAVGLLLILVVFIQNVGGYIMGYSFARLFRLPERDCRTLAFEVGTANAGLASALALTLGNIATIGLAPAIYGPMMNITGSTLAIFWKSKPLTADGKHPLGSVKDIPDSDGVEVVTEPVKIKK